MIAIFFSDIHFNLWKKFNEGNKKTKFQLKVLEDLAKKAYKNDVPLFFLGDLFHTPTSLDNPIISIVFPFIRRTLNTYPISFYGITGNHGVSQINSYKRRSPSYINTLAGSFKNFNSLDFEVYHGAGFDVYGVPYLHYNDGLMEYVESLELNPSVKNILLLHTDFRNQKDTNGIIVGKGENIKEKVLTKKFDLVLSGHIHKPGRLRNNIYSIGAPMQLRLSDMDGKFGYWVLMEDFSLKFKEIDGPKYRYYTKEEEINNKTDYWVKNISEPESSQEAEEFIDLQDKKKIIKSYLSYRGIKSRSKFHLLMQLIEEDE